MLRPRNRAALGLLDAIVQDDRFKINCRGRLLDARPGRALVMGILNVTPDSFSNGALYNNSDAALGRAEQMLGEGAVIIDVGGESTRPAGSTYGAGAAPVSLDEEKKRVLPVIESIAAHLPEAIISVDTYKAEVADEALAAGAHIVNDITALQHHPDMAATVARHGAPVIVMHSRGRPGDLPHEVVREEDVLDEVSSMLEASVRKADEAGVHDVIVDPGFGFGKSPRENLRLLAGTPRLLRLGRPVLVGVSRKSTIGLTLSAGAEAAPIDERLFGSLGATAVAVTLGASIVRTHDVRQTVEMLRVLTATLDAGKDLIPSYLAGEAASR